MLLGQVERSCPQSGLPSRVEFDDSGTSSICPRFEGQQSGRSVRQEAMALEGEDGYMEDDEDWDNHHLLSPEEYEEMMRYIEEACREEDIRAEAEVWVAL